MTVRSSLAIAALAATFASPLLAAQSDLQPLRTIVTRGPGCVLPPNCTSPICLQVVVKNNGPDTFGGMEPPGKTGGRPRINAGTMRVTVDIDEPGKPQPGELPGIQAVFTQDFVVTIAPGDSVTVNFGQVGFKPAAATHTAEAHVLALPPDVDPNPANDDVTTIFDVICITPATGRTGLVAVGLALAAAALWQLRRRRPALRR